MISAEMLRHTCNISRLADAGGMKRTQQALYTGVACTVIPLDNKTALEYSLIPGKAFALYTNHTDIKVTDKVTCNGLDYVVRGSNPYAGFGNVDHTFIALELAA